MTYWISQTPELPHSPDLLLLPLMSQQTHNHYRTLTNDIDKKDLLKKGKKKKFKLKLIYKGSLRT